MVGSLDPVWYVNGHVQSWVSLTPDNSLYINGSSV